MPPSSPQCNEIGRKESRGPYRGWGAEGINFRQRIAAGRERLLSATLDTVLKERGWEHTFSEHYSEGKVSRPLQREEIEARAGLDSTLMKERSQDLAGMGELRSRTRRVRSSRADRLRGVPLLKTPPESRISSYLTLGH